MKRKLCLYLSTGFGALALMILKMQTHINSLSALLVIVGLTGLLYGTRHASGIKERLIVTGMFSICFVVRFWGYTAVPLYDFLAGLVISLIMYALFSVEALLKRFNHKPWYTLIFPLVYFLFMYLTEALKINLPFRFDIYLSGIPVLCGISALFGVYFLDFFIGWTASTLVFFIDHRLSRKTIVLLSCYTLILCGILCFGVNHRNQMNATESFKTDTVRIAYTTGCYCGKMGDVNFSDVALEDDLASLTQSVKTAAMENSEILVFCEEAFDVEDSEEETLIDTAKKLAAENHIHLLLAYETADTDDSEDGKSANKLCWISDEGEILYDYTKYCLVPIVESFDYIRGDGNAEAFDIVVHNKTLKVAAVICYDCDFELFTARCGKNLDLFFAPSWDWNAVAKEQFGAARLRAISNETTLIRSVYDGWSAVIDRAGSILTSSHTNEAGYEKVLVYDVPIM